MSNASSVTPFSPSRPAASSRAAVASASYSPSTGLGGRAVTPVPVRQQGLKSAKTPRQGDDKRAQSPSPMEWDYGDGDGGGGGGGGGGVASDSYASSKVTDSGRSDATINRFCPPMDAERATRMRALYSAVDALPEVLDSMIVDLECRGFRGYMELFVVLRPDRTLDAALKARLSDAGKTALSPRFVLDDIRQVAELERTQPSMQQKRLLLQPIDKVVNPGDGQGGSSS